MITAFSPTTAHLKGGILPSMYRLRHDAFIKRQSYEATSFNGMECDRYDLPTTVYFAWRDDNKDVKGCTRLCPTTAPYMIEELWPELVTEVELPCSPSVWEASRIAIDKSLSPDLRRQIHGELLCAYLEWGLLNGVEWMIGVMTPPIWRRVFVNIGWEIDYLGSVKALSHREKISAAKMAVNPLVLQNIKKEFSITGSVLEDLTIETKEY